jgi:hypothetical protein
MIVLDATIMNIARPSAQKDLGFSLADRQRVIALLCYPSMLFVASRDRPYRR